MKMFENAPLIDQLVVGTGLTALDSVMKQLGTHFDVEKAIDAAIRQYHGMDIMVRDGWRSPFSREQSGIILELLHQFSIQSLMIRGITKMPYFKLIEGKIEKATRGSAAFDLFATEDILIGDSPVPVPTGVRTEFSSGLVAIIKEKSGLSVKGVEVKAGVIDSDYRDEWKVVLRWPADGTKDLATSERTPFFEVKKGMKIAQVLLVEVPVVNLIGEGIVVKDDTRKGGFGSTGK